VLSWEASVTLEVMEISKVKRIFLQEFGTVPQLLSGLYGVF